jgi:hypothetical protein
LYGRRRAENPSVVVVEGFFDCIKVYQACTQSLAACDP